MNNFYVYILKCSDRSYYVGHTDNLDKRLFAHNNKMYSGYTSSRLPIKLVFYENFETRECAFLAERKIKGWSRSKNELLINKKLYLMSSYPSTGSGRAQL